MNYELIGFMMFLLVPAIANTYELFFNKKQSLNNCLSITDAYIELHRIRKAK